MSERLARTLAALLPWSVRRDIFEPALHDLRGEWLRRAGRADGRGRRTAGATVQVLLLFFDCWRLAPRELLLRHRERGRGPRADPPERVAMTAFNLRQAVRSLIREPGFTAATVLTLALGIGANVAVFAVLEAVIIRPLPYPEAERLVILNHQDTRTGITKEFIAIGDYVDLAARQGVVESLNGFGAYPATVYDIGEPFLAHGLLASPGIFEMLRVRPALGRLFTTEDARAGAAPVMMIGHELWQSRFGSDPRVVGRSVRVGTQTRQIVGVAPPGFRFPPHLRAEVIVPLTTPAAAPAWRKSEWTLAVGRLKPGVTLEGAAVQLAAISRRLEEEHPTQNQGSLYYPQALRDALVGDTKRALFLLQAAVVLVLLIACANVANLLLVRALGRRQEMAVRLALGAGRGQLALQLLAETLVLCTAGGGVGVALAFWGVPVLAALIPGNVRVPGLDDVGLNLGVVLFALSVTLATAVAFGVIAGLGLRRELPAASLTSTVRAGVGRGTRRIASLLVGGEIAVAVVLLVAAGLILRSFSQLLAVDPGFRLDSVLTVDAVLPADRYKEPGARQVFYDRAFAALEALPQIVDAGAGVVTPLTGNNWTVPFERVDEPVPAGQRPPEVGWQSASGGYFRALGIPLRAGRLFENADRGDRPPVVVVSEALERRFFRGETAVGRRVNIGNGQAEIVGVVGDIRRAGLNDQPRADMYFPFERNASVSVTLFIRTAAGDPVAALPAVQSELRRLEPQIVLSTARTMEQVAAGSVASTRLAFWLLGLFAAVALALAAVGVYGVMSYAVRQRTREIGTRMALGATGAGIARMVMREGLVIVVAGLSCGLLAGLVAATSLRSMLFGIAAADPITLIAAAGLLTLTMLAACVVPARRAAGVDPARTLAEP